MPQLAFSKDLKPITHKLWEKLTEEDLKNLKKIELAIAEKNYSEALKFVSKSEDKPDVVNKKPRVFDVAYDLILWNKYSDSDSVKNTSFNDISRFITDNPFYPNIMDMRKNAEKIAIKDGISYAAGEQYFKSNPAINTSSKIYLLKSKIEFLQRLKTTDEEKIKLQREIKNLISEIWIKENFTIEEERSFLEKYQNQLNESDYIKRAERLLWDGKVEEAKKIMKFIDDDYKKLFDAIIDLQSYPRYLDQTIMSVPRKLRSNEGLLYRRALWHKSKGQIDELIELIIDLPKKLEYPDKWWSLRRLYAREMIKKKQYKIAYLLVAKHSLATNSSDYWEAEWFAGWLALRFLDEPKESLKHFTNLQQNVSQPVTLSRAAYWLGMSYQAMNDRENAIKWYKEAAKYPIFFYGQLALNKHRALDSINAREDIILPKDPEVTYNDMKVIAASKAARVAYLLAVVGDKKNSTKIFEYLVNNSQTEGQVAAIMRIINEFKDPQLDAKISRIAAKKNVFFVMDKFQIVKEVPEDNYSPLVHAIIKQESGFAPTALSHVGAIGFMQLMPETAKLVAKEVGIPYDKNKLATDIQYNIKLGSHYIKTLIDRFDGSEMLAIASYNAGPNSTQRWINEFYDPRKEKDLDKIVDWIELITYSETRNYVQRILENLIVYKYLMSRANYDTID